MCTIIPMNMAIINSPTKRLGLERHFSAGSEYGLSDTTSPRSPPLTPETFVVTPEGKTLPAVRELHVDAMGSLHIVDRVLRSLDMSWEPVLSDLAPLPPPRKDMFTIPVAGLQEEQLLSIGWHAYPRIAWGKGCPVEVEPTRNHRKVQIFTVDADGTTRVKEVSLKEFQKRYTRDAEDYSYVVEENGTVHMAHSVFVSGPESQVVLRGDDDCGGVYDQMPTPHPTLTPFSDIVFVSEADGKTHFGTRVMITDNSGRTTVVHRIASWPVLFVTNTSSSPKCLAYNAPPRLEWNPDRVTHSDECYVVEQSPGHFETYNRILLAANEGVYLAYRAVSNTDAIVVCEGNTFSVKSLVQKPTFGMDATPIFITTPGPQGVSTYGVNVMISAPGGFVPVARVATVSKTIRDQLQEGLQQDSVPMCVTWPQRLQILNSPAVVTAPATFTRADRLATRFSDKVPVGEPLSPSSKQSPTEVILGTLDGPGFRTLAPRHAAWSGVLLAGDGPLRFGHTVVCMGQDSKHSSVTFAVDE